MATPRVGPLCGSPTACGMRSRGAAVTGPRPMVQARRRRQAAALSGGTPKFIVTVLFHMEKVTAYVNHSRSRSGVVDEAKPAELVQEIVHALACRADKLG